jgi:type IV secretion system protein VirD4
MDKADGFILYDPCDYLLIRYGKEFQRSGYEVKTYDTGNLSQCNKYNPFQYVRDSRDIPKLVTAFLNGTGNHGYAGDITFRAAEVALLNALFGYVAGEAVGEERNIGTVIEMLNHMMYPDRLLSYDSDYKHAVDFIFEDLAARKPDSYPVNQYEIFKLTIGNQERIAVNSCIWRLKPFTTEAMKECCSADGLGLDAFGFDRKTALFVSLGQSCEFDFLVLLLYTQLFDTLCEKSI